MMVVTVGRFHATHVEQQRGRVMDGIGIGKDRMQERRLGRNLREDRQDALRDRVDFTPGKCREIEDLRDTGHLDPLRRALAADEGQARRVAIKPKPAARLADDIRDEQQCMTRRRHDELIRRDVRRQHAGYRGVCVGRRHDEDEIGAGQRSTRVIRDQRQGSETLAQRSLIFNAADGG